MTADVHVVPFVALGRRNHRASITCWCGPISVGKDLESMAPVYRHRRPPDPETPRDRAARLDFEELGDPFEADP